jgi:hypothetical protein
MSADLPKPSKSRVAAHELFQDLCDISHLDPSSEQAQQLLQLLHSVQSKAVDNDMANDRFPPGPTVSLNADMEAIKAITGVGIYPDGAMRFSIGDNKNGEAGLDF